MAVEKFADLMVWQEAHKFVLMVYGITQNYPNEEKYGLVSQMRRAAVSIPANIAEGFKRHGIRDKIRFYNIAEASLEEEKYFLILSKDDSTAKTLHRRERGERRVLKVRNRQK